jgi:hypothetical protein
MPEYGDLPPHPLVCGLAVGTRRGNLEEANQAVAYSLSVGPPRGGAPSPAGGAVLGAGGPPPGPAEPPKMSEALDAFPSPRRAPVVVFAGYLGPRQNDPYPDHGNNRTWRLLYQDAKAMSWLMVPEGAIVLHTRSYDDTAAFRLRDYIWVKADAPVRQGTEDESEQARFLVGSFTAAGDLHNLLREASTASAGSGILCAPTPECCRHGTN